jgi:phosphoribosylformylglycinamidine cyclo-ligase
VKKVGVIHGLANITGGGVPDNLARILPPGKRAFIRRGSWPVPPVFTWLQQLGNIADREMTRVFNMGVGFAIVAAPFFAHSIIEQLGQAGIEAWLIGEVKEGEAGVEIG